MTTIGDEVRETEVCVCVCVCVCVYVCVCVCVEEVEKDSKNTFSRRVVQVPVEQPLHVHLNHHSLALDAHDRAWPGQQPNHLAACNPVFDHVVVVAAVSCRAFGFHIHACEQHTHTLSTSTSSSSSPFDKLEFLRLVHRNLQGNLFTSFAPTMFASQRSLSQM